MADEQNGNRWSSVRWVHMAAGAVVAGATNYLAVAYVGVPAKLAIISGLLGAASYVVAFVQNPGSPPPIPAPPTPKKP